MVSIRVLQSDIVNKYIERLRGNASLVAALGGDASKISTHLPQDSALPYIRVSASFDEWGDKCQLGFSTSITNNIWSDHRGTKEVLELSDIIIAITQNLQLSLASGKNVLMTYQDNSIFEESDGKSYRASLIITLLSA